MAIIKDGSYFTLTTLKVVSGYHTCALNARASAAHCATAQCGFKFYCRKALSLRFPARMISITGMSSEKQAA